jgi:hypothetical protein
MAVQQRPTDRWGPGGRYEENSHCYGQGYASDFSLPERAYTYCIGYYMYVSRDPISSQDPRGQAVANQGTRAGLPFSEGMQWLHEKGYGTTQRQARNSSSVGRRQLNHAPCIIPSLTSLYFRHSMSTHPRGPVPTTLKRERLGSPNKVGQSTMV